jgi:glycosyltransferase involved in cell wall biosynthesis
MQLSVHIRNLNEEKSLEQTLIALERQQTSFEYEVVVIDNESDDDSVEIAWSKGCQVFTLPRSEFTYGRALNFGISKCAGEIIVILSAHVVLLNELFLQKIPSCFEDVYVAGLRFVLGTSPEKVCSSIAAGPQKLTYEETADFAAKNWINFIVNHCSAIKRSCWEVLPFDEKIIDGEDKLWSLNMLKRNYTILYNVPCYYVYTKEIQREKKIAAEIRALYAKSLITNKSEKIFSAPYIRSIFRKAVTELRHAKTQLLIHHNVYKGLKALHRNSNQKKHR